MSLRRLPVRIAKVAGLAALALLVAGIGVWGALLLEYAGPSNVLPRWCWWSASPWLLRGR